MPLKAVETMSKIPTKAYTLAIRRAEFPGPTRLKWEKLKTFNEFMANILYIYSPYNLI